MKKYLILLIIPLLFFSTGCEEDELVSVQETQLDPNLFGVWNMEYGNSIVTDSFSNNGNWGYMVNLQSERTGVWWTEGFHLWVDVNDSELDEGFIYSFSGDSLKINDGWYHRVN